jgi:host factor-I protein
MMTQEDYIETLIEERAEVNVYLVNGIKLRGCISDFDKHVLFVTNLSSANNGPQMVYKHAVSTISRA